ncbi:dethiobiotin synthetase [Jatrophihabitans sp. GAS493]|uniref:dethiobiotin synthase n=1 Tax=Jatrophihabitans sp. GAS493 TaxID=1907575 RepID=UPI000BB8AA62|nr:dethiobiotin synthase [Jatrophihabitans sp. GAS493]SOD75150.1 dethiobiotin synthetase [Jatrophihabitans sp. GAS493]
MSVLIVSGTGTDVGKTVATAALTGLARQGRAPVAVVKPVQTGLLAGEPGDLAEVSRLSGCTDTYEFSRFPDPLSPQAAARCSGRPALALAEVAQQIRQLESRYEQVIVEGAGGLLVSYADDHWTLLDLARELGAAVLVVTLAGLGTMNHTVLTLRALGDHPCAGVLIGRWPAEPDLAMRCNASDLSELAAAQCAPGLVGALPDGITGRLRGALGVPGGNHVMEEFGSIARAALSPDFGGEFDAHAFVVKWGR